MALPDYAGLIAGTKITWKSTGGDKAITLTSLANNGVREGAKSNSLNDATYGMPKLLEIFLCSAVGVAATDGKTIPLYIGESDSATAGTNNPGNLTGADAGLTNGDQLVRQLKRAGALSLSNGRGTNIQKQRMIYLPTCEYIVPVVQNLSGQALSATASDHTIEITPYYLRMKE